MEPVIMTASAVDLNDQYDVLKHEDRFFTDPPKVQRQQQKKKKNSNKKKKKK